MSKALDSALRLLTRRDHGAVELERKLESKGYSNDEIEDAIAQCQKLGYQSDARFIESYCRYRVRQGFGPIKIIQELRSKGLERDLIHQIIEEQSIDWFDQALEVLQKKTKGQIDPTVDTLHKNQKFLLYRGFSSEVIHSVISTIRVS